MNLMPRMKSLRAVFMMVELCCCGDCMIEDTWSMRVDRSKKMKPTKLSQSSLIMLVVSNAACDRLAKHIRNHCVLPEISCHLSRCSCRLSLTSSSRLRRTSLWLCNCQDCVLHFVRGYSRLTLSLPFLSLSPARPIMFDARCLTPLLSTSSWTSSTTSASPGQPVPKIQSRTPHLP
jgi:hypothetical protein